MDVVGAPELHRSRKACADAGPLDHRDGDDEPNEPEPREAGQDVDPDQHRRGQKREHAGGERDEARPECDARACGNGGSADVRQRQEGRSRPEEQHPDPPRLPGEELEEHGDTESERQDPPEMLSIEPNRLGD